MPNPIVAELCYPFFTRVPVPIIRPAMAAADRAWIQSLRANASALKAGHPRHFQDFEDGFQFSAARALPDQMRTDLPRTAKTFAVAFFGIQKRDDVMTPTRAAVDYFNRVTAPTKEPVPIPDAGHFAFMTAAAATTHKRGRGRPTAARLRSSPTENGTGQLHFIGTVGRENRR